MKGDNYMKIKKEAPICPKCNSKNIMARIKTGELWCRKMWLYWPERRIL